MKIGKWYLIILLLIISSCNSETDLAGKKFYALEVNIGAISIAEHQMFFTTSDKIEMTTTLHCNSLECLTKENSPKRLEKTVIREYSFKDNYLKIEGIPNLSKISFLPNGDLRDNTGETIYQTSITELSDEDKQLRLTDFMKGNKALGQLFTKMMKNGSPKPLIEKTKDDRIKFN